MAKRRNVLIGVGGMIAIAGCSGDSNNEEESDNIDIDQVKNEAREIPYNDLMRNPDDYEGEYLYYSGAEIRQFFPSHDLVIDVSGDSVGSDRVYVRWDGDRFVEGDIVDVWGEFNGLHTGENVLGGEFTAPDITALEIEIIEEA